MSKLYLLAQMFAQRIVGLQLGEIVYDGSPNGLTPDVLTQIYGEEDWEATIENVEEEDLEDEALDGGPDREAEHKKTPELDRDRLSGLT